MAAITFLPPRPAMALKDDLTRGHLQGGREGARDQRAPAGQGTAYSFSASSRVCLIAGMIMITSMTAATARSAALMG